ncbi:hypothetical protein [Primorskyibacter sp. 2E233]|uniref:hypothetical protein n=1 Tax=Primorskyibacter sp. 2E233 TaxID=3413431 RepID=UPI003BF1F60B
MEVILSIGVFLLVFGGLAIGLLLTGRPPQTACGGLSCMPGGGQCHACPNRKSSESADG